MAILGCRALRLAFNEELRLFLRDLHISGPQRCSHILCIEPALARRNDGIEQVMLFDTVTRMKGEQALMAFEHRCAILAEPTKCWCGKFRAPAVPISVKGLKDLH